MKDSNCCNKDCKLDNSSWIVDIRLCSKLLPKVSMDFKLLKREYTSARSKSSKKDGAGEFEAHITVIADEIRCVMPSAGEIS
jgi:hypothetical protein